MALTPAISLRAEASSRWRFAKTEASFLRNMPAARPDNISTNQIATGNGPTALRFYEWMGQATKSAGIANWSAVYVSIRHILNIISTICANLSPLHVCCCCVDYSYAAIGSFVTCQKKSIQKDRLTILCVCAIHLHVYMYTCVSNVNQHNM